LRRPDHPAALVFAFRLAASSACPGIGLPGAPFPETSGNSEPYLRLTPSAQVASRPLTFP
jgi:hypothetical protein